MRAAFRVSWCALLATLCLANPATADVMINAGGGALGSYLADRNFSGGSSYTFGNQSGVYNTERWSTTSFSYAIPVTPGQVQVTLRFRESCAQCTYTRIFRVDAEGQVVLNSYSVPLNTVGDRTFTVTTDATLNLVFTKLIGEAWVNAIEVRQVATGGAPSLTFSANPTSVTSGSASTLTWSSTNATSCTASGGWSGTKPLSGTASTGSLTASKTFSLTCTGAGGSAFRSVTVTVAAPSLSLTANPTTVASGGTSTLTWSSTNATTCTASGGWTGTKATSGSQSTGPITTSTVFTIVCTGAGGSASSSASVTVSGSSTSTIFPLHVETGKRHLVDAQGAPFLIHGDAAWSLMVQLTRADVDTYLENRRQKGFNTILVNLIEHAFADNPPTNKYGDPPFLTPGDFSTPNAAYFAHAEYVISKAAEKGILVLLTPAYMGYNGGSQGWYQGMKANGVTKLRTYGQYLANRFLPYDNIVWVHAGDYNPPDRDLMRAIVNGIHDVDSRWLHTFHGARYTAALQFLGAADPWLQINDIYTDHLTVVAKAFQEYARSTMPFFLIEGLYEGEGVQALGVRQQAYQAVLSGASGQVMGNYRVWNMLGNYWRTEMDSAGARTLSYLRTLLEARSWWTLQPDTSNVMLTGGISSGASRAPAALASDRSYGLIYTPSLRTLTVDLRQFAGPRVAARWYDPTTGVYVAIAGSPFAASASRNFATIGNNASGSGDWVLDLQSVP